MTKSWFLTRQAEESLTEIARWTLTAFGPRQAARYEDELIARCQAVADGSAMTQSCGVLADSVSDETLRFTRAGEHFIIFLDEQNRIVVLDFLHGRSDLSRHVAALALLADDKGS